MSLQVNRVLWTANRKNKISNILILKTLLFRWLEGGEESDCVHHHRLQKQYRRPADGEISTQLQQVYSPKWTNGKKYSQLRIANLQLSTIQNNKALIVTGGRTEGNSAPMTSTEMQDLYSRSNVSHCDQVYRWQLVSHSCLPSTRNTHGCECHSQQSSLFIR